MRNYVMKSFLALACLALVSMPLAAQKGGGGGGCATAMISTSSAFVTVGGNVGVSGQLHNCSSSKVRYNVEITATSACGVETMLTNGPMTFRADEYKLFLIGYVPPAGTCLGLSTLTVNISSGSTLLATASTTVTVQ